MSSETGRIDVIVAPDRLWRWQLWLVEALAKLPERAVSVVLAESAPPLPRAVRLLMELERLVYGTRGEHASDLVGLGAVRAASKNAPSDESAGLVLDLSGSEHSTPHAGRILRPLYDGQPDENAVVQAVFDRRTPRLAIADPVRPDISWTALPAIEDPVVLTRALDTVFSSVLRLCLKAATAPTGAPISQEVTAAPPSPSSRSALAFATSGLTAKATARMVRLCRHAPAWFVGWRWASDDRIQFTGVLPENGYQRLPDDGGRYYADPFVIEHGGRHHLFCEEYDRGLCRGVISSTVLEPGRQPERPRPVLERPYHLSYPLVFAHAGEFWMIPESSEVGSVELYRAARFPDRWVLEATLLNDVAVADATVFVKNGRWWMLAATREWQSSSWDALCVFHAPELLGPWTPHPHNPVMMDSRAARPAGHVFTRGGTIWRSAQDCSAGYGSALALCSIDRLDMEEYRQTTHAIIRPEPSWSGKGLHTVNFAGGLEVIDGIA